MTNARLEAYMTLERVMLRLDEAGDELADQVRDVMDPIWYAMTGDERALLNARGFVTSAEPVLKAPFGGELFSVVAAPLQDTLLTAPLIVHGWELAA
jgi:hypothetical protein